MKTHLMNYLLGFDPAERPSFAIIELRCQNCWKRQPVYIAVKNQADVDRLLDNHAGHDFDASDMPPAAAEVV